MVNFIILELYNFFLLNIIRTIISQGVMNTFLCHRMYKLVMNTCMLPLTDMLCSCYVMDVLYFIYCGSVKGQVMGLVSTVINQLVP
jgi:hypothetical protein